jgi:hypothetical protein
MIWLKLRDWWRFNFKKKKKKRDLNYSTRKKYHGPWFCFFFFSFFIYITLLYIYIYIALETDLPKDGAFGGPTSTCFPGRTLVMLGPTFSRLICHAWSQSLIWSCLRTMPSHFSNTKKNKKNKKNLPLHVFKIWYFFN